MNAAPPPPPRIAFYAPLKPPDDPTPSGDRTMARLLMAALRQAGFAPFLASRQRMREGAGDPARQERLLREAARRAEALIARCRSLPAAERPRLWFTYHGYYKAPDAIGPRVAAALGIPYVVAEGSRAAKRAKGPWALYHAASEAALDAADGLIAMTARDRPALAAALRPGQRLIDLPPFLDATGWPMPAPRTGLGGRPRLLAVAMMREGAKLVSYRELAAILGRVSDRDWHLDLVGDGPARPAVEAAFSLLRDRVTFHGRVEERARLAALYAGADLFLWPAVDEAYGMVLLEAQAMGVPVIAGGHGGVASVVEHGRTGLITPADELGDFADALASLLDDPARRVAMGRAGADWVRRERSLPQAAATLRAALAPLLDRPA